MNLLLFAVVRCLVTVISQRLALFAHAAMFHVSVGDTLCVIVSLTLASRLFTFFSSCYTSWSNLNLCHSVFGFIGPVWFCCVRFSFISNMLSDWLGRSCPTLLVVVSIRHRTLNAAVVVRYGGWQLVQNVGPGSQHVDVRRQRQSAVYVYLLCRLLSGTLVIDAVWIFMILMWQENCSNCWTSWQTLTKASSLSNPVLREDAAVVLDGPRPLNCSILILILSAFLQLSPTDLVENVPQVPVQEKWPN